MFWSWGGISSILTTRKRDKDPTKRMMDATTTFHRWRKHAAKTRPYFAVIQSMELSTIFAKPLCSPTFKNWEQRMGARVNASNKESITAAEMVMPNWRKYFPMTPFTKRTGTK